MLLPDYLKNKYGYKLKKISIDGGFTCPNRDGSLGNGGCIFCSAKGSGDFAGDRTLSVTEQIDAAIDLIPGTDTHYIAYFQAFTNTYAPIDELRAKYYQALNHPSIHIISIATRPDCLSKEVLSLLKEINANKPVWVELGLQTSKPESISYIRRGYDNQVYETALKALREIGISQIITHVILGLPNETKEDMLQTVSYVVNNATRLSPNADGFGIKLQLLHVLKATDLALDYLNHEFECLTKDEYMDILSKCLQLIPSDMVIHRLTGDGDARNLLAPKWSLDKRKVVNEINQIIDNINKSKISSDTVFPDTASIFTHCKLTTGLSHASPSVVPTDQTCLLYERGTPKAVFVYFTMPRGELEYNQLVNEIYGDDFALMIYEIRDWNNELSPWPADDLVGNGDFAGNALDTYEEIKASLLPYIHNQYGTKINIIPCGYSLAGLFSLWIFHESFTDNLFAGVISCSGSTWYPGWIEYIQRKDKEWQDKSYFSSNNSSSKYTYLSVGGKEASSANPYLREVINTAKLQHKLFLDNPAIAQSQFELNRGGHFAVVAKRMAKGINWLLSIL